MIQINIEGNEIAKSVCDLFSPLTEFARAIGDQIRIYRELSVLKTLKKAKIKAEKLGLIIKPPPLKFLVPFLEQVSLEDDNDDTLTNLWTNLLLSVSTTFKAEHNLFIRILGELSTNEAKAFDYIANYNLEINSKKLNLLEAESDWYDPYVYIRLRDCIKKNNTKIDFNYSQLFRDFSKHTYGSIVYYFWVGKGELKNYPYDDVFINPVHEYEKIVDDSSLSILKSHNLIGEYKSPEFCFHGALYQLNAVYITSLGSRFYSSCLNVYG